MGQVILSVVLADGDGGVGEVEALNIVLLKEKQQQNYPRCTSWAQLPLLKHLLRLFKRCQQYSSQERPWFDHTIAITIW